MIQVYHLLDEREPFSEVSGGAISRWAANVLRHGEEIVVCPSADNSWGFARERIFELPGWNRVGLAHPVIYRVPWTCQLYIYRELFKPLLKRLQAGDIVYVHNRPACAAVLATLAEDHGIKVALHMHNSMLLDANRGQVNALRGTPVIYCSQFLIHEADQSIPGSFEDTHVVYNGADETKFYPASQRGEDVPHVIFTGRLVSYKGVHILLKAMGILADRGVSARCSVVGGSGFGTGRSTSYMRMLKREAPSNCQFLGYRSGVEFASLLRNSDVFCCPSIWNDPFPLAPLEGMAAGLPVVACNVGGIPEALAYGGGIVVPPNDAERLADALQSLLTDREMREEMGRSARSVVEQHFRWSTIRKQYLAAVSCGSHNYVS